MLSLESQVLLLVIALFAIGAALIYVVGLRNKNQQIISEIWQLYLIEFILVAAILFPIYFGGIIFYVFAYAFLVRCVRELFQGCGEKDITPIEIGCHLAGLMAVVISSYSAPHQATPAIVVTLFTILAVYLLPIARRGNLFLALSSFSLILVPVIFLVLLYQTTNGFLYIFLAYVIVELNDSFAYLSGKIYGKRHPFPVLSPKKSIEGVIGGIGIALSIGTLIVMYLLSYDFIVSFGMVLCVIVAGFFGDFITSAIKRSANIKDFPKVHTFHGGVLDIYDAFLFSLSAFYLYYILVIENLN